MSKILERILVSHIFDHLTRNHILHPAQHGFTKRRSTCTNLLESLNDWTLCLQSRQQVAIVYIDFSKAFDVISHRKLLARLDSYGILGSLLLWLKNGELAVAETANGTVPLKVGITKLLPLFSHYGYVWKVVRFEAKGPA